MGRSKRFYDGNVWKYALKHQQLQELKEIIERSDYFTSLFKPCFVSSWFEFDSVKAKRYNYLEYYPLINARAHQLGKQRTINNKLFEAQYKLFLEYAIFAGV